MLFKEAVTCVESFAMADGTEELYFGSTDGFLLNGLVIIEFIFQIPGMGRLAFEAVNNRDYPIVQGVVMIMAVIFLLVNLMVDLSYAVLDPRIRYS